MPLKRRTALEDEEHIPVFGIPTASTLALGRRPASLAGSHVSLPFGGAST